MRPTQASAGRCHLCGAGPLDLVPDYGGLGRVTSDCKPWPRGGWLGVCPGCAAVQKVIDPAWHEECAAIYRAYTIYHQSGGVEQPVFAPETGAAASRSSRLVGQLTAHVGLPETGRLLDVGSGNGALLRAFHQAAPRWALVGTELGDKYRAEVESIPGVEAFYNCPAGDVPGRFTMVSMIHVLEHVPGPGQFLEDLGRKLNEGGLLLLEVPDHRQNPFELLIADHASHFTAEALAAVVESAGFEVIAAARNWVPKEISLVARKAAGNPPRRPSETPAAVLAAVSLRVRWLRSVTEAARGVRRDGPFGVLGTSIAGTWLFQELDGEVDFFVDEDPHRAGRQYLGRPIYAPAQVPPGGRVFIALPHPIAAHVRERLGRYPGYSCHLPPTG
jgi:SAM-dependent methyltransferase